MDYLFEIECTGKSLIFVMGQYLRISFITLIHKTSPVIYKFILLLKKNPQKMSQQSIYLKIHCTRKKFVNFFKYILYSPIFFFFSRNSFISLITRHRILLWWMPCLCVFLGLPAAVLRVIWGHGCDFSDFTCCCCGRVGCEQLGLESPLSQQHFTIRQSAF